MPIAVLTAIALEEKPNQYEPETPALRLSAKFKAGRSSWAWLPKPDEVNDLFFRAYEAEVANGGGSQSKFLATAVNVLVSEIDRIAPSQDYAKALIRLLHQQLERKDAWTTGRRVKFDNSDL